MRIKAIPIVQGETTLYFGVMKAAELVTKTKVDMRTNANPNGYQREVSQARAKSYGRYISIAKGISPNSILLNVRNSNALKYKDDHLIIEDNEPLWLVDGQHRVKGLEMLMPDDSNLGGFELPVLVMSLQDNYHEAKQFWIINKTQKGVRSDLAERILQRAIYEEGKQKLIHLSEQGILGTLLRGFEWKGTALAIADTLNTRPDSPWYGMICMPGEPRDGAIISQTAFVSSLEPILKEGFFASKDKETIVQMLINYWNAAKDTWPGIFDSPEESALLKTTGVSAMHILLPVISSYTVDKEGKRVLTQEALRTIFAKLAASGIAEDFWSHDGEAGKFGSGRKSQRLLAEVLIETLSKELGPTSDIQV